MQKGEKDALEGVSKDIRRKVWGKCIVRLSAKKQQAKQEHPLALLGKATMLISQPSWRGLLLVSHPWWSTTKPLHSLYLS